MIVKKKALILLNLDKSLNGANKKRILNYILLK